MYLPCELYVKKYLPVLRAEVARALVEQEGFTQAQAASALGVTQAAVSKYLSLKTPVVGGKLRGQIRKFAVEAAKSIARGKPVKLKIDFCSACGGLGFIACSRAKKEGGK
ncbi:MAG: transcriptional regulator [Candidatus Micrarchaeia archaeon]